MLYTINYVQAYSTCTIGIASVAMVAGGGGAGGGGVVATGALPEGAGTVRASGSACSRANAWSRDSASARSSVGFGRAAPALSSARGCAG